MKILEESVSRIIFDIKEGYGLTDEDIAELLKVSRKTVNKWKNNRCLPKNKEKAISQLRFIKECYSLLFRRFSKMYLRR